MSNDYQLLVPGRERVNAEQITTLLHITNALQVYLLAPHRAFDSENPHPELDGGALAAATVTFGKACEQLNNILSDASRWSLDKVTDLNKEIVKTQQAQQGLLAAQTKLAENALLPHSQLKPLVVHHGGMFLAIHGDPATPAAHIVGRGFTPEAALYDFDLAFKRLANDQYQIEVEEQPQPNNKKNDQ
jgi:hypothetical protein